MSAAALRTRFNIVPHIIKASAPSFSLACNQYKRIVHPVSASTPAVSTNAATPPLLFAHATGFHKELWEPIMARLTPPWGTGDMYAFDCRNHGDSAVLNKDVLEETFDWYYYAHDILQIVDTFDLKQPIAVGHSILAELIRPGTFSAIVAIDPTMFPSSMGKKIAINENLREMTLRRRDTWINRAEAKAQFLKRPFFQAWDKEIMDIYIEYGLKDSVSAHGTQQVTLKTPKQQEAATFGSVVTGIQDAFERLGEIQVPIHVIAGETSDINPPELLDAKMQKIQQGSLDMMKGSGHLLNLEKPAETAKFVSVFLDRFMASQMASGQTPGARL
ncbi:hypothetical protein BGX21_009297 [Mortierella sp. AD011]|nr:hypothetical protein BGX20_011085 [Mortierella sp. AD010]KAF9397062.1 hypothetical protein BGX21_009297 [Mortierella sp. AD011]